MRAQERLTRKNINVGLDAAFNLVFNILDIFHKFKPNKIHLSFQILKSCFLSYINLDFDKQFLINAIHHVKTQDGPFLSQYKHQDPTLYD